MWILQAKEERLAEKAKRKAAAKRMEEVEARRKQEEEARRLKLLQQVRLQVGTGKKWGKPGPECLHAVRTSWTHPFCRVDVLDLLDDLEVGWWW